MIKFSDYSIIKENFNQMKSLIQKYDEKSETLLFGNENGIPKDSEIYQLLYILIGPDTTHKNISSNTKFTELYGNIQVNEEKERVMRPYLGMFAKMFYEEKCPLQILNDISQYILNNKATLNQLKVKNNHNNETTVLSNLLDVFKFRDSIRMHDKRPAYEILTDAIRDKDKDSSVSDFINEMPSILKKEFKDNISKYQELENLIRLYENLDISVKENIYSTFFGNATRKGKISRYHNTKDFLSDFGLMVSNIDDFNNDILKTKEKILSTRGAKLVMCDLNKNIIIADIWNYQASKILGEPNSWCVSYPDNDNYWYRNYMNIQDERKMYFIWNFNLPFNEPMCKIGANIDSDNTYYLICDKTDNSIGDSDFDDYISTYNIDKNLLNGNISPEEKAFREKDTDIKDLINGNIFKTVKSLNYEDEIPRILSICSEEGIDITPEKLYSTLSYLMSRDCFFDMINLILDILGTERYTDLFTQILCNESLDISPSEYEKLMELFERLGSVLNYNIMNLRNIKVDLQKLPTINKLIFDNFSSIFYKENLLESDLQPIEQFIEHIVTCEYLDGNFDMFFNQLEKIIFYCNKNDFDIATVYVNDILSKIHNFESENNFLIILNDLIFKYDIIGKIELISIPYNLTGFTTIKFCTKFFKKIFDKMMDSPGSATRGFYKEHVKQFILNHENYLNSLFEVYKLTGGLKHSMVALLASCGLDVRKYKLGNIGNILQLNHIYAGNTVEKLYAISHENVTFHDYTTYAAYINTLFETDNIFSGENIKYIKTIFDNFAPDNKYTDNFAIILDDKDLDSNMELLKCMFDYNIFSVNAIMTCIEKNLFLDKCKTFIKTMSADTIVMNLIGINESIDEFIYSEIDISNITIGIYTLNKINPVVLEKLIDKGSNIRIDDYGKIIEDGFFRDSNYDDISIRCLEKSKCLQSIDLQLNWNGDNMKIFENSLAVLKYIYENIEDKPRMHYNFIISVLSTNDMDKIEYFIDKGLALSFLSSHNIGNYQFSINVINLLINNNVIELGEAFLNIDSFETFEILFDKYWKDLETYSKEIIITNYYMDMNYEYITQILDFLCANDIECSKIITEFYEENKRKKVISTVVRDWLKNKFYSKSKVKKIREMFEIFKNLVKY